MTALLELKQKIKNLYGQNEIYILPVLKFALALTYFLWINEKMGYMSQLNNLIIVLILALICSIMPPAVTIFVGFVLMLGHAYALGIEVAAFLLVLILLIILLCCRKRISDTALLTAGLILAAGVPFLLPYMHDRYFFLADVLAVAVACAFPDRFPPAVLVQLSSLSAYLVYSRQRYTLILNLGGKTYTMLVESLLILAVLIYAWCLLFLDLRPGSKKRRRSSS